jgi:hypothetical protein
MVGVGVENSFEVAASEDQQPVKTHAGGLLAEKRAPART